MTLKEYMTPDVQVISFVSSDAITASEVIFNPGDFGNGNDWD